LYCSDIFINENKYPITTFTGYRRKTGTKVERVKVKLIKIKEFVKEKESLISGLLSILILVGWAVFLLGFVFTHGVCCGDDAGLSMIAKSFAFDGVSTRKFGYDLHLAVILPVSLGIRILGNSYWIPGLSMVVTNAILLLLIGFLVRASENKMGISIASLAFFYLNYALLSKHFEHWYAALGEVPAGLLILLGVLLIYHRDSWLTASLAGLSFCAAFITKMTSLIALGSVLLSLLIQLPFSIEKGKNGHEKSILKKGFFLSVGFGIPLLLFESLRRLGLGPELHLNRWLSSFSYFLDFSGIYEPLRLIKSYQQGAEIFLGRFGVPFVSLVLIMLVVGVMVKNDDRLQKLFYVLFAIFLFHSTWWFFFSIHWARHYVLSMMVVIFAVSLPFLSSRPVKWRTIYFSVMLIWSSFTWKQLNIPIKQLDGHFYTPTEKTEALIEVSELLSHHADDELVISQESYTFYDLRYLSDESLRFTYFRTDRQYSPPFWIAMNTKFMHQHDPAFMQLLRGCSGLKDYNGNLVGRCE
jgi:hypothetical protein